MVAICRSREELALALPHDRTRGVVMTMGALHAGHAALLDAAREDLGLQGHITTTIFVNPLQFAPGEDFGRYPRTPAEDAELAAEHGTDALYLPTVADVYGSERGPDPDGIVIQPGELGARYEGVRRPTHFAGVLTVVMTLLHLTRADVAYFGEKDYQQLVLIRSMARRFALPVQIRGVPTVRDPDGLALSSRNVYLSGDERQQALAIPASLEEAQHAADSGVEAASITGLVRRRLQLAGLVPDYVAVTDPDLGPPPEAGQARILVAVPIGTTRLLDNAPLTLKGAA